MKPIRKDGPRRRSQQPRLPPPPSRRWRPRPQAAQVLESITVVGSRRVNASATDTPVPIDFIPMAREAEDRRQFDLAQTLHYISPSFNSTRQTGADGADLIDSAALRGLGPTRRWCW